MYHLVGPSVRRYHWPWIGILLQDPARTCYIPGNGTLIESVDFDNSG